MHIPTGVAVNCAVLPLCANGHAHAHGSVAAHCPHPHDDAYSEVPSFVCRAADGEGPFPGGITKPGDHLRKIFYRMGLNDQEIVVLSGPCSSTLHMAVTTQKI